MAVANNITKQKDTRVMEYQSNGENIKLTPAGVRKYLVSGGGNVTDEEINYFMVLCKYQHLNPFIRDAYLIKYGEQDATIVIGKDVFVKRAKKQPEFDGFEAGIIVRVAETGEIIERQGTFYDRNEEAIVGGWCRVYLKNTRVPFYTSVSLNEYIGRKKNGEPNQQWSSKPATMIRKVALAQALRDAFPEQNSGNMYVQEEIAEAQNVVLNDDVVVIPEEQPEQGEEAPKMAVEPVQEQAPIESASSVLFG